jgi:hypothetical protein
MMNTLESFAFTAHIGIDWSDTKHDICIQPAGVTSASPTASLINRKI